jgi:hypothetical protein
VSRYASLISLARSLRSVVERPPTADPCSDSDGCAYADSHGADYPASDTSPDASTEHVRAMSYPFVAAYAKYGTRKGPIKAFVVHMAEGCGTFGFLSRPNERGVSVHYVIEYTGRIVQMVRESEATGSINPNDLRTTDDAAVFGATVGKAVMGDWWKDPNSATITCEIEGFAAAGPNAAQHGSLKTLVKDVRSRFPTMGLLGHRDFQDYKPCPGKLIHWSELGGHGPAQQETDVTRAPITDQTPKMVTANDGHTWRDLDGTTVLAKDRPALVARLSPYGINGGLRAIYSTLAGHPIVIIDPATTTDLPVVTPNCDAAVKAEHDRVKAAAVAAVGAL